MTYVRNGSNKLFGSIISEESRKSRVNTYVPAVREALVYAHYGIFKDIMVLLSASFEIFFNLLMFCYIMYRLYCPDNLSRCVVKRGSFAPGIGATLPGRGDLRFATDAYAISLQIPIFCFDFSIRFQYHVN